MSIKNQAAKGVMWNAIERFSTQGMQFVLTIVIARILSPDDYGLVAMLVFLWLLLRLWWIVALVMLLYRKKIELK